MHPILLRRIRLTLYLAAWTPALALLAYVARANGETSWLRAAALLAPAAVVFAFACLSAWYVCRVQPLRFSEWAGLAVTWTSASLSAGALLATPASAQSDARPAGTEHWTTKKTPDGDVRLFIWRKRPLNASKGAILWVHGSSVQSVPSLR